MKQDIEIKFVDGQASPEKQAETLQSVFFYIFEKSYKQYAKNGKINSEMEE